MKTECVCACLLDSHMHLEVAFIHGCLVECCTVQWMYPYISGLLQAIKPSGAELSLASINCLSVSHLLSQTEDLTPSSTLSSFLCFHVTVKGKVTWTKLRTTISNTYLHRGLLSPLCFGRSFKKCVFPIWTDSSFLPKAFRLLKTQ